MNLTAGQLKTEHNQKISLRTKYNHHRLFSSLNFYLFLSRQLFQTHLSLWHSRGSYKKKNKNTVHTTTNQFNQRFVFSFRFLVNPFYSLTWEEDLGTEMAVIFQGVLMMESQMRAALGIILKKMKFMWCMF